MDITFVIEALIALVSAIITAFVVPYIKSRTTAAQQEQLQGWVKIAVAAAEQIYTGSGRGSEKKAYVVEWLTERGLTVDTDKVDALIESAVYDLSSK